MAEADLGSKPVLPTRIFPGRVIPVVWKLVFWWLHSLASGVTGSALGLVGPVPAFCDLMKHQVCSAASISVWQHAQWSEQIFPEIHWYVAGTLSNQQTTTIVFPVETTIAFTARSFSVDSRQ